MRKVATCFAMLAVCATLFAVKSHGLKQAELTAVVNDVSIINPEANSKQPAKVKDVVSGKKAVNTGLKSRAELMFDDKTLTRLGANTVFSFEEGTRVMNLKRGTMLLQVPKNHGGATVHTASITAAITGTTVMLHYQPGQKIKLIVLEGTLKLYLNGRSGEFVEIHAGQMIMMDPNSKTLPNPIDVDLKMLVKTSDLINGFGNDHLGMALIRAEIARQQKEIKDSKLVTFGQGDNTSMDTSELLSTIDQAINANTTTHQNTVTPPSGSTNYMSVGGP